METTTPALTTNYKFAANVFSLNSTKYATNTNGITGSWVPGNISYPNPNYVFYDNPSSYYYTVSSNQLSSLAHSIDGVNWEVVIGEPISNSFYNVFFENYHQYFAGNLAYPYVARALILSAQAPSNTAFFRSTLGAWKTINLPNTQLWITATFLPKTGRMVVLANNTDKGAYSNDDGLTWAEITLPASRSWSSVACGTPSSNTSMPKFVAVAKNTDKGAYSTDGTTWVEFTLPAVKNWSHVAFIPDNEAFYAIADGSNQVAFGYDNEVWEFTTTTLPFTGSYSSLTSFFENGYGTSDAGKVINSTVAIMVNDSNQGAWQPVSTNTNQNTPWQTFTLPFSSNWGTIFRTESEPPLPWEFLKPYWLTEYASITANMEIERFLIEMGTQNLSSVFWQVFPSNSLSARTEKLSAIRISARQEALIGFDTWAASNSTAKTPERQAYRANLFSIAKQKVADFRATNYNAITALTYSYIIQEPLFISAITNIIAHKILLEQYKEELNDFTTLSTVYVYSNSVELSNLPK